VRIESVDSVRKGIDLQRAPGEGTRIRRLYDVLQTARGLPIDVNAEQLGYYNRVSFSADVAKLRDFYGMDIILIHRAVKGRPRGKGRIPSLYILAGEWFGREYQDYVAPRVLDKSA
jgi:hypothetical protein